GVGAEPVNRLYGGDFEWRIGAVGHLTELIHGRLVNRLRRFRRGEKSQADVEEARNLRGIVGFYPLRQVSAQGVVTPGRIDHDLLVDLGNVEGSADELLRIRRRN